MYVCYRICVCSVEGEEKDLTGLIRVVVEQLLTTIPVHVLSCQQQANFVKSMVRRERARTAVLARVTTASAITAEGMQHSHSKHRLCLRLSFSPLL